MDDPEENVAPAINIKWFFLGDLNRWPVRHHKMPVAPVFTVKSGEKWVSL